MREFPPSRLQRRYADGSDMLIAVISAGVASLSSTTIFSCPSDRATCLDPIRVADRGKNNRGTLSLSDSHMGRSGRLCLRHPP